MIRSTLGRFGLVTTEALRAILDHPDGSPTTLAVYVALATHADRDEATSWRCSVQQIAEEAGVSERSVRNAKSLLSEIGLLEVTPNWTADGDRGWDSYLIRYVPGVGHQTQGVGSPGEGGGAPGAGFSSDQETDQVTDSCTTAGGGADEDAAERTAYLDAEFELFWAAYGRVGPKKVARKCWDKAIKKATPQEILDGLFRWVEYWQKPGAANVKWPQGWLNEERWEVEPPPIRGNAHATRSDQNQSILQRMRESSK